MKNLLLISLLGLTLIGCEEKKVTEEMLIGDWECSATEQRAKWKNGVFQNYSTTIDHGKSLVTYLKENDSLFVKLPDSDEKIKQDFKKLNESYEDSLGDRRIVGFSKLEYISDNEFKLTSESTRTQDKQEDNEKIKTLMHCTRIK
ncbi:hypothetical protein A9G42_05680 [Gilliamella sp. Nev6-6]|uniref:hypothetical protein n=1 Tax=Gilliamella sp. Nev6-6 TaxID=3120252 RepID=UPI00080F566A|nr:hypothetical protein [Gilliamella apicola]OCG77394.1 hypothetical protein A9G42_05680 [Gilliamella apicola]